jgi:hypothetical protein
MKRFLSIAAIACWSSACSASPRDGTDIVATYDYGPSWMAGSEMIVEAGPGGAARIEQRKKGSTSPGESYTLVTLEGRNLAVSRRGEGWRVADAVDLGLALRRGQAPQPTPSPLVRAAFAEAGTERVARWTGTRYVLPEKPWTYDAPSEIVVMKSGELAPVGRALRANYLHSLRGWPVEPPAHMKQMADLFAAGMPLRIGDATLKSIEKRPADPSRFRPPAPVLSREALFREIGPSPEMRPPVAKRENEDSD